MRVRYFVSYFEIIHMQNKNTSLLNSGEWLLRVKINIALQQKLDWTLLVCQCIWVGFDFVLIWKSAILLKIQTYLNKPFEYILLLVLKLI